ncbi:hypothetical protein FQN55_002256 [Onygenales sp. PD_40]|nr:hypothetical protein FQN55_002256 [Onygenales sp. PD_40]
MDGSSDIEFFSAPSDFGDSDPENDEIPTTTPTVVERDEEVIEIVEISSPTPTPTLLPTDERPTEL